MWQLIIEFSIAGAVGFLVPGPILLSLGDLAKDRPFRYTLAFLGGIFLVDLSVYFPALFMGKVLQEHLNGKILGSLTLIGAAYLLYLGIGPFFQKKTKKHFTRLRSLRATFVSGIIISFFNGSYWGWWAAVGIAYLRKFVLLGQYGPILYLASLFFPAFIIVSLFYYFINALNKKSTSLGIRSKFLVSSIYILLACLFCYRGMQEIFSTYQFSGE